MSLHLFIYFVRKEGQVHAMVHHGGQGTSCRSQFSPFTCASLCILPRAWWVQGGENITTKNSAIISPHELMAVHLPTCQDSNSSEKQRPGNGLGHG